MGDEQQIPNEEDREQTGASFPGAADADREPGDGTDDADRAPSAPDLLDDNPQGAPSSEQA